MPKILNICNILTIFDLMIILNRTLSFEVSTQKLMKKLHNNLSQYVDNKNTKNKETETFIKENYEISDF